MTHVNVFSIPIHGNDPESILLIIDSKIISCFISIYFAHYFPLKGSIKYQKYARCVIFVLVQPLYYLFSAWLTLIILLTARVPQYFSKDKPYY